MNDLKNRQNPRLRGFDYNTEGAYFVTICTQDKKCILSHIVGTGVPACPYDPSPNGIVETGVLDCPNVKLLPYGKIANKYIKQLNDFYEHISVDSYVIMPNHIHLMLLITRNGQSGTPVPTNCNSAIASFISTFKRFCNKEYGKNIWQPRYFDHIIRNFQDYSEHLEYINNNPLKWELDKLYTK